MSQSAPRALDSFSARAVFVALAMAMGAAPSTARAAPGATLNQYRPAATGDDVFAVSRAAAPGHLEFETRISFDYANDPLVYESQLGASESERVKLVSDQLTMNLGVSLGLFDPLLVYADLPLHLVMSGDALAGQPAATGFGTGDVGVGARYVFLRFDELAALGVQAHATLPFGEGSHGAPALAGDAGVSITPIFLAEMKVAMLRLVGNVGFRFREDADISGVPAEDELVWGAAVSVPLVERKLDAHVLGYGSTPSSDVGRRAGSPLEVLLGLRLSADDAMSFGVASGLGLSRGYGSPDFRVVVDAAWRLSRTLAAADKQESEAAADSAAAPAETESKQTSEPATRVAAEPVAAAPAPGRDSDHDGVADAEDTCPIVPGTLELQGCSEHFQYAPQTGLLAWTTPIHWRTGRAVLEGASKPRLEALAQALTTHAELQVRIDSHVGGELRASAAVALTRDRAKALLGWLVRAGIDRARISAYACGSSRPLPDVQDAAAPNHERTEVYVTQPAPTASAPSTEGCQLVELPGE